MTKKETSLEISFNVFNIKSIRIGSVVAAVVIQSISRSMKSLFSKRVGQHVLPLIFIHNSFVLFWCWYWSLVNTYHGKSCTDHTGL